jgi:predicted phosphodiesterase
MRIALFSDIHGNITGLEAVLRKIKNAGGADSIVAAGDLIVGNSGTDEIIELLVENDVRMVRGDSDSEGKLQQLIEGNHPGANRFPNGYYLAMHEWLEANISKSSRRLLDTLPVSLRIECAPDHSILICHAAPEDPASRTCSPHLPAADLIPIFESETAEVIAFGHAHSPHVRWVDGRLYVNVASVAFRPDDTSMLTFLSCENGRKNSALANKAVWTIEQFAVPYDGELERKRMSEKMVPQPEDFR